MADTAKREGERAGLAAGTDRPHRTAGPGTAPNGPRGGGARVVHTAVPRLAGRHHPDDELRGIADELDAIRHE